MLTLFFSESGIIQCPDFVGYILSAAEIILVLINLLKCFIPKDTKFGKWLHNSSNEVNKFIKSDGHTEDPDDNRDAKVSKEEDDK
jgi:hypothetical protein